MIGWIGPGGIGAPVNRDLDAAEFDVVAFNLAPDVVSAADRSSISTAATRVDAR